MSNLRLYAEEGHYAEVPAEQLLHARKNWFIGWKCLAGSQSLFIDQEGLVFSAGCKSTGIYGRRSSLGNVFREFRIENAPVNCARRFCDSEFDLAIPKYHRPKHRIVLEGGSVVPDVGSPVAISGSETKRVLWNFALFELKPLSEWKNAVHRLEIFCKGETIRFIIQDPPCQSRDFFDFLKFLTEEKGHLVTVEGFLQVNLDFYIRSLVFGDLCLKLAGEENVFFRYLDKLGDEYKHLQSKRKINVQVDLKNPEHERIRYRLTSDSYKDWLQSGFYIGHSVQPPEPVIELKNETEAVKDDTPAILSKAKILLFIPMRNCSGTIAKVIAGLDEYMLDYVTEILILDNDSTDDSMQVAAEAIKSIKCVKVVLRKNAQNYGFGGSHKLAFQYAQLNRMDYLLVVHGDNSGSPKDFIPILKSGEYKNYDIVLSSRLSLFSSRKNYSLHRFLSNWILNIVSSFVTLTPISDFSGGPVNLFRVQSFINKFENPVKKFDDRISFQQHALLYVNYRKGLTRFVPIQFKEAGGKSFYTAATQFIHSLNLLMKYIFSKKNLFR